MGYGAQAKRVTAKRGGFIADVDMYNLGIIGRGLRGVAGVQREQFNLSDYRKANGGFSSSRYMAHVIDSFFEKLDPDVQVEVKTLAYVATDATQASGSLMDTTGSPAVIYTIAAARKGAIDKSAFGNDIRYKIALSQNVSFKLTADASSGQAVFYLDQIENLLEGYFLSLADGTNTEIVKILTIDRALKKVTATANLTNAFTAALTTASRLDWNLSVGVLNDFGVPELKEEYLDVPFAASNSLGMALIVNDADTGSDYIKLTVNGSNASPPATVRVAAVSTWTALTGGSDGTGPVDADWLTLAASFVDEQVAILLAPESTSTTHNANMAGYATTGTKWLYYGQAANGANEASLKTLGAICRAPYQFGMIPIDKWIEKDDPSRINGRIQIPAVGHAAAHWFNSYAARGASHVAAGNEIPMPMSGSERLLDSNGLVHDDAGGIGGRLIRNYSINLARFRRGLGVTINSARTLSTDDGYVFQNQIMQFLLIKRSIKAYFQKIEQNRSGVDAQSSHRDTVWAYLKKKYDAGEFYHGQHEDGTPTKFEEVVQIVNDFSNNSVADIANGKETTFVQFVEAPPIEEPTLDLASAGVTTVRG